MVGCQDGGFAASQQSEDRRGFLDRAFFFVIGAIS